MKYSDFNLHLNKDVSAFNYNNNTIKVLKYLPIEEKNDIIQLTLQNADENGQYNYLKLDMYFKLYIVYSYTDIEFDADQKMNASSTYDELESNGLINAIINAIPAAEYEYLFKILQETLKYKMAYRNTVAAALNSFVENLPVNAKEAKEIIEKFNPEDFQQVINFATAANGNRPIN